MNSRKVVALLIFIAGITLVILGGVYNPYSEVINLPQGGFRGIGFSMYGGESVTYTLNSMHTFTIYIMNSTVFHKLMNNGTFNGSYYTETGKSMNILFKAPANDVYYIVIANFNSADSIEVDFAYHKGMSLPLFVSGSLLVLVAIAIVIADLVIEGKREVTDAICPECGNRVNSSWNFCPYCRHEFRRDEK